MIQWWITADGEEVIVSDVNGNIVARRRATTEHERREFNERVVSPMKFFVDCANEGYEKRMNEK
jgi:hypothetical protein